MAHTAVNTLEYVEDLEQAGVQSAQARAMAKALDKVLVAHLATKTDVAEAKSDLEIRIGEVRTELAETRSELKTEIGAVRSELKTDIADVNTRLGALEVRVDALPHRLGWRLLGGVAVLHAIAVAFLRLV
jgi:hypothetical protein